MVLGSALAWFAAQGALGAYVECTWTNNWQYVGNREGRASLLLAMLAAVPRVNIGLWLLGGAGLAFLALGGRHRDASSMWLLLLTTWGSALGAGAIYRHYGVPIFLPLSMGIGAVCAWLVRHVTATAPPVWPRLAAAAVLALAWAGPAREMAGALADPAGTLALETVWVPPAAESRDVARYVAERTSRDQSILVVGSEPQIYYYARRRPSSRMVFTYPITGPYTHAGPLRSRFLNQLERGQPVYVVLVLLPGSLSEWPSRADALLRDAGALLQRRYVVERSFDLTVPSGKLESAIVVFRLADLREPTP